MAFFLRGALPRTPPGLPPWTRRGGSGLRPSQPPSLPKISLHTQPPPLPPARPGSGGPPRQHRSPPRSGHGRGPGTERWVSASGTGAVKAHAGFYNDALVNKRNTLVLTFHSTWGGFAPGSVKRLHDLGRRAPRASTARRTRAGRRRPTSRTGRSASPRRSSLPTRAAACAGCWLGLARRRPFAFVAPPPAAARARAA